MDARQSDLLDLHDNVARRVRNLETGVHPLRSEAEAVPGIPPTLFPPGTGGVTASSHLEDSIVGELQMRYQKQAGIGCLIFYIQFNTPETASDDGELWGRLPEPLRPTIAHMALAVVQPYTSAPPSPIVTPVEIRVNGDVVFYPGGMPHSSNLRSAGITWPVA